VSAQDYQQRFLNLRDAVLAYDRALRAYGLLGSAWVEHSDELDTLWTAVLRAARAIEEQPV
jgi:hypothetical protein